MRCSTRQFLFFVLFAGFVLIHESRVQPLEAFDAAFTSWLNINTQHPRNTAPLTLVQITDDDLRDLPWPWPPLNFSLFLNAALPLQPSVIAIEPVLAWRDADGQRIAMLHNQLLRSPKVLLGSELGVPWDTSAIPQVQELPVLRNARGDISSIQEYTLVTRHPAQELRLAGYVGFENLLDARLFHASKAITRVPLLFRYRGQVLPSFVLQAVMLWFGVIPDEVTVFPGSHIDLGQSVHIPIDSRGSLFTDFSTPMTHYSVGDLLLSVEQSQARQKTLVPIEKMKSSLVMLARSDRAAQSLQLADGRMASLGEVLAAAIATIQNGQFVRHPSLFFDFLILLAGIGLAWRCSRLGKVASASLCLAVLAAYLLVALAIFPQNLLALPIVMPAGLIGFIALFRQLD